MQAAPPKRPLTTADCDRHLARLADRFRRAVPFTEERIVAGMEIDTWLEQRVVCKIVEEAI